jgi:hypothetical protein
VINADSTFAGANAIVARRTATNLIVTVNGTTVLDQLLTNVTSLTVNGQTGNDTFTIDFASGGAFNLPITYNGGTQTGTPGDTLSILGGAFNTATYDYTNANDGRISLDPDGPGGVLPTIIN